MINNTDCGQYQFHPCIFSYLMIVHFFLLTCTFIACYNTQPLGDFMFSFSHLTAQKNYKQIWWLIITFRNGNFRKIVIKIKVNNKRFYNLKKVQFQKQILMDGRSAPTPPPDTDNSFYKPNSIDWGPRYGGKGAPNFFLTQILFFCDLKPHAYHTLERKKEREKYPRRIFWQKNKVVFHLSKII